MKYSLAMLLDRRGGAHTGTADPGHRAAVMHIERAMLVVRYFSVIGLLAAHLAGLSGTSTSGVVLVISAALAHNSITHWLLYTQRDWVFLSPFNFVLYLGKISLVVGLSGPGSPLAALYIIFIVGYCTYAPDFLNTASVALVSAAAYLLTLTAHWLALGGEADYTVLGTYVLLILFCGWLASILGTQWRQSQATVRRQAKAMAVSESMARRFLDHVAFPVIVHDDGLVVQDANEPACALLKRRRDELIGEGLSAIPLRGPWDAETGAGRQEEDVAGAAESPALAGFDVIRRSFEAEGSRWWVAVLCTPDPEHAHMPGNGAGRKLARVQGELRQTKAARSAFLVTYQRLRSPLTATAGYADMLVRGEFGELNGEQRRALQAARRALAHVLEIMDEADELHPAPGTGAPRVEAPAAEVSRKGRRSAESGGC